MENQPAGGRMRAPKERFDFVHEFLNRVFIDDVHAKRILSLANGALGVMAGAALAVSVIGQALAQARGLLAKSAIKQVDRLLSNAGVVPWELFGSWVREVVGVRRALRLKSSSTTSRAPVGPAGMRDLRFFFALPSPIALKTKPRARAGTSILGRDRDSTPPDRLDEGAVVAKVLVGVFDREFADRVVERRIGAHVARDLRRIAGSRVRPSQRPGA